MQGSNASVSQIEAASGFSPQSQSGHGSLQHQEDFVASATEFLRDYSRSRPEVVALWAFGIGFVLGWKLKPW